MRKEHFQINIKSHWFDTREQKWGLRTSAQAISHVSQRNHKKEPLQGKQQSSISLLGKEIWCYKRRGRTVQRRFPCEEILGNSWRVNGKEKDDQLSHCHALSFFKIRRSFTSKEIVRRCHRKKKEIVRRKKNIWLEKTTGGNDEEAAREKGTGKDKLTTRVCSWSWAKIRRFLVEIQR